MTAAQDIIKSALKVRGEFSVVVDTDPSMISDGFSRLLQMLAVYESDGLVIPLTIPVLITDDLEEPGDATGPFIDNLAVYLTGIQTDLTRDQKVTAKNSLEFLERKYLNAGVIPEQLFASGTPKGAGNTRDPYTNEFFPDPDAVLDNNQGVVNAPLTE